MSDRRYWQSRQSLITYADNDMLMGGGVEQSCATHVRVGGLAGLPYNRLTSQHTISSFAVKKLAAIVVLYSFKLQKILHGTDSDVRNVVLRRILTLSSSLCDKGSTYPHN